MVTSVSGESAASAFKVEYIQDFDGKPLEN
jgi:hypothetical protein